MSSSKRNTTRNRHDRDRQDQPPTRSDDNNEHATYTHHARARGMSDALTGQGFDPHSPQQHHSHHHVANNASSGGGMDGSGNVSRVLVTIEDSPEAREEQALLRPLPQGHPGAVNGLGVRATRDRSDSGIRGRSISNATDPKQAGLHSHSSLHSSTREGSITPTAPPSSPPAEDNPAQASETLPDSSESKISEMAPAMRISHSHDAVVEQERPLSPIKQPSSSSQGTSLLSSLVIDSSKLAKMGFGRRSRQDLRSFTPETSSAGSPTLPSDIPGPTPPAKDTRFLSPSEITPPSPGTSKTFHSIPSTKAATTVSSDFDKRYISRQQSDMALNPSSSRANTHPNDVVINGDRSIPMREYRRRSVSDAGPSSRPLPSSSVSTTSGESSTISIHTPVDDTHSVPQRSPVSPTDEHEYYDLYHEIYISPPRSDHRGKQTNRRNDSSAVLFNSSSFSGTGDAATAEKGKKMPWRNRLLAVATSGIAAPSSADNYNHHHGGRTATSNKSRMHLWASSSQSSKPVSPS